jgi:hypothetical protein
MQAVARIIQVTITRFVSAHRLVFDPVQAPPRLLVRALQSGAADLRWDVSHLPSRTARAYIMGGIGLLWVGLGGALLMATELLTDRLSLAAYYALAAACVTCGAFTTHGLAGFLSHSPPAGASSRTRRGGAAVWRFWQPFRGGTAFVLAQVGRRAAQPAVAHLLVMAACLLPAPGAACPHVYPATPRAPPRCAGPGLGAVLVCAGGHPVAPVASCGGCGLLVRGGQC